VWDDSAYTTFNFVTTRDKDDKYPDVGKLHIMIYNNKIDENFHCDD
jgi:hypothetical protein